MIKLCKRARMMAMNSSMLFLAMSITLPAWADETTEVAKRPNILFAMSDDQSYPHASILGDPVVKTPAFDRIAREGVLFTHSFAACPSCTPSRSAILTGRQIWQLGEAGVLFGTLHPEYALFTHLLEDAGYHVGFVGKPWAPGDWRARGLSRHPNGREYAARLEVDPPVGINTRDYAANFEDFLADRPDGAPFISSNKAPHGDIDDGPFKDFMLRDQTRIDFPLAFELGFGKRPLEELYDLHSDPHQINNLAENPQHAEAKQKLWRRLNAHLKETADPRIDGKDPWQNYIYRQVEGFGATYNMSLTEKERAAARAQGKHRVSPGAKE
jgi:hypothetical protein